MSWGKAFTVSTLALSLTGSAHATVCLLASEPANIERAVVVESPTSSAPATWLAVDARGRTRIAWLVDHVDQTTFEPRGRALLEALDGESTPRFIPDGISGRECGRVPALPLGARRIFFATRFERLDDATALARALGNFAANASDCSLELPAELVEFEAPDTSSRSDALRVFGDLPLGFAAAFRSQVTFLTLGPGRASWPEVPYFGAEQLFPTYFLSRQSSDYPNLRDRTLRAATSSNGILEAVMPLFRREAGEGDRAPLIAEYFRGAADIAASSCTSRLENELVSNASLPLAGRCSSNAALPSDWPTQRACSPPLADGTAPSDALICDGADDFALALAGLVPKDTWLTRVTALVSAGQSRTLSFDDAAARGPWYLPSRVDTTGCTAVSPSPTATVAPTGKPEPVRPGAPVEATDSGDEVVVITGSEDSCSCGAVVADGGDSTASESSASNDSCAGDSSDSGASDDDSCAGNSEQSDDEGDTCSGNPSSSHEEGDSCSSHDSSSSAALTGSAPAQHASLISLPPRRGRHARASVWTLALSTLWLPVRRRGRRRSAPR
jgi:hypothetical protein